MGQYNATSHCNYSGEVHLIFICKERKHLLRGEIQEEIHRIASISESGVDTMGSDKDHSHILLNYKPKTSVSMMVRRVKTQTSATAWKNFDSPLKQTFWRERTFCSDRYFACSVGDASTDTIRKYSESQG
jgi:putative transposase